MNEEKAKPRDEQAAQVLEPVEQAEIPFHHQMIVAVRLSDDRICVVLRWVCESLNLQPGGQVRKIERTAATASELVRVRVETRGGKQTMPALTMRGFSPWVLSLNPNEVNSGDGEEDQRIRTLITAYQEEAKDVLYEHFLKSRNAVALPAPTSANSALVPIMPADPGPEANAAERAAYYEDVAVWALWNAARYNRQWRTGIEQWVGSVEDRLEGDKAMLELVTEIAERIGPEPVTNEQQASIRALVKRHCEQSGEDYQLVYWELTQRFHVSKYTDIPKAAYPDVVEWFKKRTGQAANAKTRRPHGSS